ncbi:brix domain-containing protein [Besnoitia besnoiti]|uniref:Brix domain-containing protein n=1 Tax=Besnoitia besnoiti TaxID=94643 RepID=A0A2A9M5N5_BESBE|nr:brix domain-containing protein [Besnoitia besnoiti]PFH33788.1 brix domain-containing protein [Besnoitia besnoiti]
MGAGKKPQAARRHAPGASARSEDAAPDGKNELKKRQASKEQAALARQAGKKLQKTAGLQKIKSVSSSTASSSMMAKSNGKRPSSAAKGAHALQERKPRSGTQKKMEEEEEEDEGEEEEEDAEVEEEDAEVEEEDAEVEEEDAEVEEEDAEVEEEDAEVEEEDAEVEEEEDEEEDEGEEEEEDEEDALSSSLRAVKPQKRSEPAPTSSAEEDEEGEEDGEADAEASKGEDPAAAAEADPYLLAEAHYLRKEKRWVNRQRVLVLGSRGVTFLQRHLMEDFKKLLPHHKAESKWERKQTMKDISELAQLRSCNNVLYFESRKRDLLLHVSKIPHGPTVIFRVLNIHTLAEMKMTGNCLLHSRPLLLFSPEFGSEHSPAPPHLALLKELFIQVFGTPRNHPKAKPFFDHAFAFYKFDGNRIWFRHYQIAPLVGGDGGDADKPDRQTFIEIGPRCVLEVVKILDGAFSGKTLWSNKHYVCSRDLAALQRVARAQTYAQRVMAKEKRSERLEKSLIEESPLAFENVFGDFVKDADEARSKKKRKLGA